MMQFDLVKFSELNKTHFEKASTWAQYYEPEDINALEEMGFNGLHVTQALENVGWSDDYWFAVPDNTPIGTFSFEYRKAQFKTKSGMTLNGYVVNSGHCICLYGAKQEWDININLLDLLEDEEYELKADLGLSVDDDLLPLKVKVLSMDLEFLFGE